jgi:hypothetical protein
LHKHNDGDNGNAFSWKSLGDINMGRPNLGSMVPVFIYRLMLYTLQETLRNSLGRDETDELIRAGGHLAGVEFCNNMLDKTLDFGKFVASLQKCLRDNCIGIMRIENADIDKGLFNITMAEDLDCSGLPLTHEVVCKYDEGFLAGILEAYSGKPFIAREVDCWASGERVCRFNVSQT